MGGILQSLLSAKVILKEDIISHFLRTLSSLQHHIQDAKKKRGFGIGLTRKAEEEMQSKLHGQCEKTWVCGVLPSGVVPSPAPSSAKSWGRAKQQTVAALECCMQCPSPSLSLTFSLPVWLYFSGPGNTLLPFQVWLLSRSSPARGEGKKADAAIVMWQLGGLASTLLPQGSMLAEPCRLDGLMMEKDRRYAAHSSHLWDCSPLGKERAG